MATAETDEPFLESRQDCATANGSSGLVTAHLYYDDTYRFSNFGRVVAIEEAELNGAKLTALVLDQTVMHPQGGEFTTWGRNEELSDMALPLRRSAGGHGNCSREGQRRRFWGWLESLTTELIPQFSWATVDDRRRRFVVCRSRRGVATFSTLANTRTTQGKIRLVT